MTALQRAGMLCAILTSKSVAVAARSSAMLSYSCSILTACSAAASRCVSTAVRYLPLRIKPVLPMRYGLSRTVEPIANLLLRLADAAEGHSGCSLDGT